MDTGEDKPDDSPYFSGMAAFQTLQRRQARWLQRVVKEPWFRSAPHKVLFCHIPLWFTRDIFPTERRWECHDLCRSLWVPTLVKAGVKCVVSGHTHDPRWMPAGDGQTIAQLVGGAPHPKFATFVKGEATRAALRLTMSRLDGTTLYDVTL